MKCVCVTREEPALESSWISSQLPAVTQHGPFVLPTGCCLGAAPQGCLALGQPWAEVLDSAGHGEGSRGSALAATLQHWCVLWIGQIFLDFRKVLYYILVFHFHLCFSCFVLYYFPCLYLQKNPEEDGSGKTLSWEPGHLLLTIYTVRSIEQLLPFFNVLSQVFNSKVTSRCVGHSGSPVLYPNCFPSKDIKMENLKTFSSKARQKIEEMVEKDFLEGVIKSWTKLVLLSLYVV